MPWRRKISSTCHYEISSESNVDRCLGKFAARGKGQGERQRQDQEGAERGRKDEAGVVELLERGLRQDAKEQRRQRQIDDEKIHPGQTAVGDAFVPSAGKSEEDQAEIGQREVEDVDHSNC